MKHLLLLGLGLLTGYDTITTITGTASILGGELVGIGISVVFSLIITGFLLNTMSIMVKPRKNANFINAGAQFLWILALGYDLWTSFVGNNTYVLNTGKSVLDLIQKGQEVDKILILIGLTIFVSSAPIAISYILHDEGY